MEATNNPVTALNELIQKNYGVGIQTKVISVVGDSHRPTVTVKISLPCGLGEFIGSGCSQKEARIQAAIMALDKLYNN